VNKQRVVDDRNVSLPPLVAGWQGRLKCTLVARMSWRGLGAKPRQRICYASAKLSRPSLPCVAKLKKKQLWSGGARGSLPARSWWVIDNEAVLRRQRNQGLLGRRKAGHIPHPRTAIRDFAGLPIVATGVGGEDDVLEERTSLLAIDPEEHRRLG
jgi:hypothetical protein